MAGWTLKWMRRALCRWNRFTVCVNRYYRAGSRRICEDLQQYRLAGWARGFFIDHFTFGQPLYMSQMIALVMGVPGVQWVDAEDVPGKPNRFRRWGKPANGEFGAGKIVFDRLEIPRLDNNPSLPENGRIDFIMEGGM
jgi:hypothetical protein